MLPYTIKDGDDMKNLIRKISLMLVVLMVLVISFGCTPKSNPAAEEKISTNLGFLSEINTENGKSYITISTNETTLKLEVTDKSLIDNLAVNEYYMVAFNQNNIVKSIEPNSFIKDLVEKYGKPNGESEDLIIKATDKVDYNDLTLLDSANIDFNKDGTEETIELYTVAQRYNGEIAWDDGQNWVLVVRDADNDYILFNDYVQLGGISFYAYFEGEDFVVTTVQSGTANLKLTEYRFDKESNSFISKVSFTTHGDVNMFHQAPLGYK